MPSGSYPVNEALEAYVAGRVKAERLVIAVSAAYYRESENGTREALQPLMDVIDRASPGIVELGTVQGGSGFDVRLAERPFPKQHEPELRRAAEAVLSGGGMRDGNMTRKPRIPHLASPISRRASRILSPGSARCSAAPRQPDHHSRQRASHPVAGFPSTASRSASSAFASR